MTVRILIGDCGARLAELAEGSVQTCVTSPPYFGLRDYGHAGQMGLEATPDEYVAGMVAVFREVRRVLKDDGTLWLNLGDSYSAMRDSKATPDTLRGGNGTAVPAGMAANRNPSALRSAGLKHKDLIGIPWRVAFALQSDGWYLRSDIIWHKPNPMPESVTDRPTKSHEYLFLLSKSERYYYDSAAIAEAVSAGTEERYAYGFGAAEKKQAIVETGKWHTGNDGRDNLCGDMEFKNTRNKRTVWTVPTKPFKGAHFATFPPALIEPCILAGSKRGDTVLDPFGGAGTTALVADQKGRDAIICELNPAYAEMARERIQQDGGFTTTVEVAA